MFADKELTAKERADLLCGCLITEAQLSALSAMREWMALDELRGLFSSFGSFRAACRSPEFPATLRRLLADPATAELVKTLLKHTGGIARLENDRGLRVSAPLDRDWGAGLAGVCERVCGRVTRGGCLPQNIMRLLADPATAELVKTLIKRGGGIARLENEEWLAVSATQS